MARISKLVLTLYGRTYCHLCEDMLTALGALRSEFSFEVEVVDVDADPLLDSRFGELVPVLTVNETELCHYFLDETAVQTYFSSLAVSA